MSGLALHAQGDQERRRLRIAAAPGHHRADDPSQLWLAELAAITQGLQDMSDRLIHNLAPPRISALTFLYTFR